MPTHVAIIMDGNGRWAAKRGLGRTAGHKRGGEAVKNAIESAVRLGVRYLTLFGFSSENWKRSSQEVDDLMDLFRFYLRHEIEFLAEHGVRLRMMGDLSLLPPDVGDLIALAESKTAANARLDVILGVSYGGRAEIVQAVRRIAEKCVARTIELEAIDEPCVSKHLYLSDVPDPDLIIRTSGEKRISNFLLWQAAYSEFIFLETLWPDFSRRDFESALAEYQQRERRYGAEVQASW